MFRRAEDGVLVPMSKPPSVNAHKKFAQARPQMSQALMTKTARRSVVPRRNELVSTLLIRPSTSVAAGLGIKRGT